MNTGEDEKDIAASAGSEGGKGGRDPRDASFTPSRATRRASNETSLGTFWKTA